MSKLNFEVQDYIPEGYRVYTLTIPSERLAQVNLSEFDQALLNDVEHGEPSSTPIADALLGLETLVKRIEEQS